MEECDWVSEADGPVGTFTLNAEGDRTETGGRQAPVETARNEDGWVCPMSIAVMTRQAFGSHLKGECDEGYVPVWTASYITGCMRANDSFSLWKRLGRPTKCSGDDAGERATRRRYWTVDCVRPGALYITYKLEFNIKYIYSNVHLRFDWETESASRRCRTAVGARKGSGDSGVDDAPVQ